MSWLAAVTTAWSRPPTWPGPGFECDCSSGWHRLGAAVSIQAFDGVEVALSRYSYLVSLLPSRIVADLGAPVRLARRPFSSYTPAPATAGRSGLLIGPTGEPRAAHLAAIGAAPDAHGFAAFYRRCRLVTARLWPTLIELLRTREQARRDIVEYGGHEAAAAWQAMVDEPIGHAIAGAVANDLLRGVIATDALIGTFARMHEPSLMQNICFLYHLVGGGTGVWHVPIGGMGSVTSALATAAARHGAEIVTGADVFALDPDGTVRYHSDGSDGAEHLVRGRFVLVGVTPAVLASLLGEPVAALAPGAQVKVNMVVRRLPGCATTVSHRSKHLPGRSTSTRHGANWMPRTRKQPAGGCRIPYPAKPTAIR